MLNTRVSVCMRPCLLYTSVLLFIKRRWLTWSLLACSVVLLVFLMNTTKTSLVPDEDQGVIFVNVSTAAGSSLTTTDEVMERIEKRLMAIPQLKHCLLYTSRCV